MTTCETDKPHVSSQAALVSEPLREEAASSEEASQQVTHVHHQIFTSGVHKTFLKTATVFLNFLKKEFEHFEGNLFHIRFRKQFSVMLV